jgi:4-phosphopantoate--beta-alanine ligase
MRKIPKNHPRYISLETREQLTNAVKRGITHETGLIAHGRGEAFDYLIGENTIPFADDAERVAAASLILAENPVISVNGNVAALSPRACVTLAESIHAKLEVNLFHRTQKRVRLITKELEKNGAKKVYGENVNASIPGLLHDRGLCSKEGIYMADVVLVPLEDGDRCQALRNMGKKVIAIDLNPISRTARMAHITIVDNVVRALPAIERWVNGLKHFDKADLQSMISSFDNIQMLRDVLAFLSKRLNSLL